MFLRPVLCLSAVLGASVSFAQLPAGITFDDGFTWLECHNLESVEGSNPVNHWVLESSVRLLGTVPDRSGLKFVLKQNGKVISETMSDGYPTNIKHLPGLEILKFWKDANRTTASGPMTVDVVYIDGNTNKEHLAKTLKIDVRKAAKVRGGPGSREAGPPTFYLNRHGELLSSILYFREYEAPSYTQWTDVSWHSARMVEIVFNYSENENFDPPTPGRVVIEVNGQPISMRVPDNDMPQDSMGRGEVAGKFNVQHSDRDAEKYFKAGTAYMERIGFVRRSIVLPLQWGPQPERRPKSNVFTNDHAGDWKVTWLIERKPVRVFRFKVGGDGLPVQHEEQAKGLNLAPNAVLVETEIPEGGGIFDGRLTGEFVKAGGFYGRAWESEAMKRLAAGVPKKGRPFPVSSKEL